MRTLAILATATVFAGCALRPRYAELVPKETPGTKVQLQLIEVVNDVPVEGAMIEVGEYRNKVVVKTDAQGLFTLPVDKKYFEDNSILVVSAPSGIGRTRIVSPSASQGVSPPPTVGTPPPLDGADAGS